MARRLPVRLHPLAEDDAKAAFRWYFERNAIVADAFFVELDAAMIRIAQNPRRWPRIRDRQRCYVLARFPFNIVYIEHSDCIEILAVAHHRRRPGYWSQR